MRTLILLSASLLLILEVTAQPVLNKVYDFQPGHHYKYKKLTTGSTLDSTGISTFGANLNWDFSTLTWDTTIYTDSIISCANSIYGASFPSCAFVYKESNGIEQYYAKSNDTVYYLGNSYGSPATLDPPPPSAIYPTSYHPSDFVYSGFQTYLAGVGYWTYQARYNAYGTLKHSPTAVFPNVGLYFTSGGNAGLAFSDYIFFQNNEVDPLLRIQFRHTPGGTSLEYIYASEEALTANRVNEFLRSDLTIFPNPASEFLEINSGVTIGNYTVHSIDGRVLSSGVSEGKRLTLHLNDLPTGLYLLQIRDHKGLKHTQKFFKQ